jgi:diguanylate cyclase
MSLLQMRNDFKDWFRKRRVLLILASISAVIGIVGLASPLEMLVGGIRNKIRDQPVSGQIVVIGIDEKALKAGGAWPWNDAQLAQLTERLFDSGARRVFFNMPLSADAPGQTPVLAKRFAAFPGRVFVSAKINANRGTQAGQAVMPSADIAAVTQIVTNQHYLNYWNGVAEASYSTLIAGNSTPSIESALAGVHGPSGDTFPIDYGFGPRSIPYHSAADILPLKDAAYVKDKDVVVGLNAASLSTELQTPGKGRATDVFVTVLGAETLMSGRPVTFDWWPAWLFACLASLYSMSTGALPLKRFAVTIAIAVLLIGPIFLEDMHIRMEIMPGMSMMLLVSIVDLWHRFGARQKNRGTINPVSGLFTTNAIRHEDRLDPRPLVAARIRRFTEVVSALPPESEKQLIKEIVGRLELGAGGAQLYHGDDGNFFWLPEDVAHEVLVEQFQALHVIFRSPVKVLTKAFDVDISFGLDREFDSPLSHRMTSALAAAHSAEQEGTSWKLHDRAAIEQKEWTLSMLGELDEALEAGRIWVSYQPKIDLATKEINGAEALVRWTHETRGPVSPSEFVEMAERHGRIDKLTAFVMDRALQIAREVRLTEPDFTISVNISPGLLGTRAVMDMTIDALKRHALDPHCLILEVTETMAMIQSEIPHMLMDEFRQIGIGISIDDYGTGLSTLEYLRKIPATELKVDRRFTMDICTSQADQAVMKSTIQLAHALGMKAVAEGIETAESLYLLASMGCDTGQGYHIAKPMDGDSLIGLIKTQRLRLKHG